MVVRVIAASNWSYWHHNACRRKREVGGKWPVSACLSCAALALSFPLARGARGSASSQCE
jgi:hypothetical protein